MNYANRKFWTKGIASLHEAHDLRNALMKFNLLKLRSLAKKYHLALLVMFGSQASDKAHSESDLDLAFYAFGKVNEEKLYEDIIHLFKRADIDLVNLSTNHNHLLRFEALHKGVVLYEAEKGLKSRMEWQSYFDYVDFKLYYSQRSKLIDKKLAEMAV